MVEKGKKEKHDEQVQFAAYKQFCDNTEGEKTKAIADATEQIEILKADIEQYAATAAEAAEDVAKLEGDIATWTGDIKAATAVRQIDKAAYDKTHADYSQAVAELEGSIAAEKAQHKDVAQASFTSIKTVKHVDLIDKKFR